MTQSNGGTEKKQHVFFDNTVSLKYYFSIVDTFDNRDKKTLILSTGPSTLQVKYANGRRKR